jgi:hypothetical protein
MLNYTIETPEVENRIKPVENLIKKISASGIRTKRMRPHKAESLASLTPGAARGRIPT